MIGESMSRMTITPTAPSRPAAHDRSARLDRGANEATDPAGRMNRSPNASPSCCADRAHPQVRDLTKHMPSPQSDECRSSTVRQSIFDVEAAPIAAAPQAQNCPRGAEVIRRFPTRGGALPYRLRPFVAARDEQLPVRPRARRPPGVLEGSGVLSAASPPDRGGRRSRAVRPAGSTPATVVLGHLGRGPGVRPSPEPQRTRTIIRISKTSFAGPRGTGAAVTIIPVLAGGFHVLDARRTSDGARGDARMNLREIGRFSPPSSLRPPGQLRTRLSAAH